MAEENNKNKGGFSGIKKFWRTLANSEEYNAKLEEEEKNSQTEVVEKNVVTETTNVKKVVNTSTEKKTHPDQIILSGSSSSTPSQKEIEDFMDKIDDFLHLQNEPGIDFLEVLDSAVAVGGEATAATLAQSFTILRTATGGALTKEGVVSSGEKYKQKILQMITGNISDKEAERSSLITNKENERSALAKEINELSDEIILKQKLMNEKQTLLNSVDAKYEQSIFAADKKINLGKMGLQRSAEQLTRVIEIIKQLNTK